MWDGICERGETGGRGSMASLEGLGAGSVMEHFLPCGWIHFSKVPLCTEPFVSTLFLLNKKGELYYCANESSRQRQILPRFLLISKSYRASEVPQKLTYSLRQLYSADPLPCGWQRVLFPDRPTRAPVPVSPFLITDPLGAYPHPSVHSHGFIWTYILGIVWKCGFRCCSIHFYIQLNMYGLFTIVVCEGFDICEIISWGLCESYPQKNTVLYNSLSQQMQCSDCSVYKYLCNTLHGLDTGVCPVGVLWLLGLLGRQENLDKRRMGYILWFFRELISVVLKTIHGGMQQEYSDWLGDAVTAQKEKREQRRKALIMGGVKMYYDALEI